MTFRNLTIGTVLLSLWAMPSCGFINAKVNRKAEEKKAVDDRIAQDKADAKVEKSVDKQTAESRAADDRAYAEKRAAEEKAAAKKEAEEAKIVAKAEAQVEKVQAKVEAKADRAELRAEEKLEQQRDKLEGKAEQQKDKAEAKVEQQKDKVEAKAEAKVDRAELKAEANLDREEEKRKIEEETKAQEAAKAQKALKAMQARRAYLVALEGEYSGSFSAIDSGPAVSSPLLNDKIKARLTLRIQLENDFVQFPEIETFTADQISARANDLSLRLEVVEEAASATALLSKVLCTFGALRPDVKKGTLRFICSNAALATGREYLFGMDDAFWDGVMVDSTQSKLARTSENLVARSSEISSRLMSGEFKTLPSFNVKIQTPYGKEYFGMLERQSEK